MSKSKGKVKIGKGIKWPIVTVVVALCVGLALFLRVVPCHNDIFVGHWIKFAGGDAYYYMRLVDDMVANFPHLPAVDPYLVYPDGQPIISFSLFARIIAGLSWAIGLGNPSQHLVDLVGAFVPAVIGALIVIPVYFIGKALWGRMAGLMAAFSIAILPGEFLGRSILGFADHHVAEVLFSTVAMLFLLLAMKSANQSASDFKSLLRGKNSRVIVYSALAGLWWGMYSLTWQAGLLFMFIIFVYFAVQLIISHLKGKDTNYLCIISVVFNLVGMAIFLPSVIYSGSRLYYLISMLVVLIAPIALWGLSFTIRRLKLAKFYYLAGLVALVSVGLWVSNLAYPHFLSEIAEVFSFVFMPSSTQRTTIEMQPLLFPNGVFTLSVLWGNFGLLLFTFVVALLMLLWNVIKNGDAVKSIIVVWSVIILMMAIGQRRFAYYLSVNVVLLSSYLFWIVLKWVGVGEQVVTTHFVNLIKGKKKKQNRVAVVQLFDVGIIVVILSLVAFLPLAPSIVAVVGHARYAPSNAWCESMDWLKDNSPHPFEEDEYSVLSWWDYGYWITRMGQRVPVVNPGQDPLMQTEVACTFMSADESSYGAATRRLGAKYVVIDFDMVTGKYWAIATYAGIEQDDCFGIYYVQNGAQLIAVSLFYPKYYEAMAVRLYNFDGKAVVPQYVDVVHYEIRRSAQGDSFNVITDLQRFGSYTEAEAYVSQHDGYEIVGNNPFVTPVPLQSIKNFKMVYGSTDKRDMGDVQGISEVKIFEYVGDLQ